MDATAFPNANFCH